MNADERMARAYEIFAAPEENRRYITNAQTIVAAANDMAAQANGSRCPRCGRTLRPWPTDRGVRCSPSGWAHCIREVAS